MSAQLERENRPLAHPIGAPDDMKARWDEILDRLGRAVFQEQERLLPEGQSWSEMDEGDRSFWRLTAHAVVSEMRKIVEDRDTGPRTADAAVLFDESSKALSIAGEVYLLPKKLSFDRT
jgi:hypothetical protein